ncbi:MAG: autotransporter outer membrane beta-barrel domain-containing protein [Variovorax sp.]|nr:autotransporter outer membrane beta-barrel domain-containing protein [Variovorax sp.]
MNRIHRIVINRRTGACQAVSETAQASRGGAPGTGTVAAFVTALLLGLTAPAQAGQVFWVSPVAADWTNGSNWNLGSWPSAVDDAYIDGGQASLSGGATGLANYVSVGNSSSGTVAITGGGHLIATRTFIGTGAAGTLTVSGVGSSLTTGGLLVGWASPGTLTIGAGGTVTTGAMAGGGYGGFAVELGSSAGGAGTLNLEAGGTLEVGGAGALPAVGAGTGTFNFNGGTLRVINSDLSGALPMTLGGTTSTVDTNGLNATLAGALSGAGALTKSGAGTLTLTGTNTYQGATTISAGTLALAGSGSLFSGGAVTVNGTFDIGGITAASTTVSTVSGAGNVALGSKELVLGGPANGFFSGSISGDGAVRKTGSGVQVFSGVNTYLGGTTVSGGVLQLSNGGALANSGTLQIDAGASVNISGLLASTFTYDTIAGAGNISIGAKGLTTGAAANTAFAGVISGSGGSLVKQGAGTMALDGANTFTGLTDVRAGRLEVGGSAAAAGARLQGNAQVRSGAALGGFGTIAGNVVVDAGARLSPGGTGAGNAIGTLRVGGDLTLAAGAQLDFDLGSSSGGFTVPGVSDSVSVGGNLTIGSSTLNITNAGTGPGLYNLLSWDGSLSITGGGFAPPAGASLQILTATRKMNLIYTSGFALQFWNANGQASSTQQGGGSGTWSLSNGTWADSTGAITGTMQPQPGFAIFGGAGGNVAVNNSSGAVSATGLQFASDGYHLSGDVLTLVADAGHPAPVEVRVGDGSAASAAWRTTIDNVIAGSDGLAKTGAGTLVLTGTNTYTGGTTVRGGVLEIGGDANLGAAGESLVLDGGALRIASGGAPVTLNRAFALGAGGAALDLTGATLAFAGGIVGSGDLTVGGNGGTLNVATQSSYGGGTTLRDGVTINLSGTGTLGAGAVALGTQDTTLRFGSGTSAGATSYTVGRAGSGDTGNQLVFTQDASAATSTIALHGAGGQAAGANALTFEGTSTAASATIVNQGGVVSFRQDASAGSANIANGDASVLRFADNASAPHAQVVNAAGGTLDVSGVTRTGGAAIGSLGGAGAVALGGTKLTLGSLNRGDVVSGTVSGNGGSLVKVGSGTLTLAGANTYTGGTALKEGRLDLGHDQALGTGALAMDDGTTLGFAADGLTIGNAIVMTGSNDPVIDTGGFGATLAGAISGGGFLTKQGAGTLTLSGVNTYTGATDVAQGTLRAGAANTLSAASAHNVAAGAMLDLAGFDQRVASLANAGTVSLRGAAPGTTLTVTGAYVGNGGVLSLGTVLDGDGPSDRLVLDGPGAAASGRTTVRIANLGGLGEQTRGNGIEIVGARNGATTTAQTTKDAFALAGGHVDAGAYEYRLYAADADGSGESWYLRSSLAAPSPVVTYRPEASLFASLPHQLRQGSLAMLGDLHKRVGDDDVTSAKGQTAHNADTGRRAWGRVIASDIDLGQAGTVSPTSRGDWTGFQAGTDLMGARPWRAGIYVGQLDGNARVNGFASGVQQLAVGRNDLRSQYLGLYATYAADNGIYADTVLQAARHRYDVEPIGSAGISGKGDGLTASIEVGRPFALGSTGWILEPQAQLVHQHLDLDDATISGARIEPHADSGWTARLGVRIKGAIDTDLGMLQPYGRVNVYRSANGTDVARFVNGSFVTDIAAPIGGTSTELAGGFTLTVGTSTSVYGEIGRRWSAGGDAKVEASVNGSVGVRVRW